MTEEDPLRTPLGTDKKKEIKRHSRSHNLLISFYGNNSESDQGIKYPQLGPHLYVANEYLRTYRAILINGMDKNLYYSLVI